MNNSCCGVAGFLFGHKFKGRYDHGEQVDPGTSTALAESIQDIVGGKPVILDGEIDALSRVRDAFRDIVAEDSSYVQDVCQRCGEVAERVLDDPLNINHPRDLMKAALESLQENYKHDCITERDWDAIDELSGSIDKQIIKHQEAVLEAKEAAKEADETKQGGVDKAGG